MSQRAVLLERQKVQQFQNAGLEQMLKSKIQQQIQTSLLGESSGKLVQNQQKVQRSQLKTMFLMDVSLLRQTSIQPQSVLAELLVKRLLKTKIAMQSKTTKLSQVLKFVVMQPAKMLTRSTLLWETVIPA